MISVLPNPIQRGYFVDVKIQAADIVAGIIARIAEIFSNGSPRMNNFIIIGQLAVMRRCFVSDNIIAKIFGRRVTREEKPFAINIPKTLNLRKIFSGV